ncbi:MAG: hypothetical protein JJ992_02315 [Planctomycetes bacterium]|nr:hypothetical protein [Planctomycetota bacterium]
MSFRYRSASVLVGIFPYGINPGDRGPLTQVQIEWPDAHFRCSIVHPPRPPHLTASDGLHEWHSGHREFDSRYSLRTSDEALMSRMLNEVVLMHIEHLRRLPGPSPLLVELGHGVLRISKVAALYRVLDLQDFVRTSLELYVQTLLANSEGITFVEPQDAQPLDHVICQICGEEIQSDLVFCRRCKTPHHRECWLYNGRCSVFGCGELNFHVPRQAKRSVPRPADEMPPS